MTPPAERITRGFSIGEDGSDTQPSPRPVRTRQQIMEGVGKRPPAAVPLAELSHNPLNPREELTDIDETAESLRVRGQLQPVAVVRRAAFLAVHPEQAATIGEADYVVIDGNRRLAAAHKAGLAELRIDVNDSLATTGADLLESALIANIHRVDVAPIDQAKAVQELVQVHGQQNDVAARLGKSAAWVSQRLALLKLPLDLQKQVEDGTLHVRDGRRIGTLPPEQQHEEAAKAVNRVKPPRKPRGSGRDAAVGAAVLIRSETAVGDPQLPTQTTALGAVDRSHGEPVNPVNRAEPSARDSDALTVFARYIEQAESFEAMMRGISDAYRKAAMADGGKAEALLKTFHEHLARATRYLPPTGDE